MSSRGKKHIYILLSTFLVCEIAVVFLHVPLIVGAVFFLFVATACLPTEALILSFPIGVIMAGLSVCAVMFDVSETTYPVISVAFLCFILMIWALIVKLYGKASLKKYENR